jgi:phosphinothricin acetyltransferase
MDPLIRLARDNDAGAILAIYTPIVRETSVSFEVEPPDEGEMRRRIAETLAFFPWLVYERDGEVLGYAYATRYRLRAAYQWSVEVTVYVRSGTQRSGVGRSLYQSLFAVLRLQGFGNAYAAITLPNPASVGLHEALGFRAVGVMEGVGYKLGAWHDVGWWQLALQPRPTSPEPPRALEGLRDDRALEAALAAGLSLARD